MIMYKVVVAKGGNPYVYERSYYAATSAITTAVIELESLFEEGKGDSLYWYYRGRIEEFTWNFSDGTNMIPVRDEDDTPIMGMNYRTFEVIGRGTIALYRLAS